MPWPHQVVRVPIPSNLAMLPCLGLMVLPGSSWSWMEGQWNFEWVGHGAQFPCALSYPYTRPCTSSPMNSHLHTCACSHPCVHWLTCMCTHMHAFTCAHQTQCKFPRVCVHLHMQSLTTSACEQQPGAVPCTHALTYMACAQLCEHVCSQACACIYVRVQPRALKCMCTHPHVRTCVHLCALTCLRLYPLHSHMLALHMLPATRRHAPMRVHVCIPLCTRLNSHSPPHLCSNARTHTGASPASRPNTCARARRRAALPTPARVSVHTCAPACSARALAPPSGRRRPCAALGWGGASAAPGAPCDRQGAPKEGTGHHPAVPWSIGASWNRISISSTATCSRARPLPPRGCPKSTGNFALAKCQGKHCIHLPKCCDPYMHPGGRVQALTPTQPRSTGSRRHLPTPALQVPPVPQGY